MVKEIRYVKDTDVYLVQNKGDTSESPGSHELLLGARIHIDPNSLGDGWVSANKVPDEKGNVRTGFVEVEHLSTIQLLKIFYVDVGQGDATLIEAEGTIIIIDGGPNKGFHEELIKRLKRLQAADIDAGLQPKTQLHINAIIVTHFDKDHFYGLIRVLEDSRFSIGKIYHNGLPRYGQPAGKDVDLGVIMNHNDGSRSISTDFRDIQSARNLLNSGDLKTAKGNDNLFAQFLRAVLKAFDDGRLGGVARLYRRDTAANVEIIQDTGPDLNLEVLAPITTKSTGTVRLPLFPDPHDVTGTNPNPSPSTSHTVNGNSIVLRLVYGGNTFLFGGDLNQPAQKYLAERYDTLSPTFRAEVNKACHHGSSDFDVAYLRAVAPHATVFSSGDNGSYDHPLPDAIGAAAKHSQGDVPLVFSTELARETSGSSVKLGHINARSNGQEIVMAQKKEKTTTKTEWHAFEVPSTGPFG
jgi:beta-lactamase superfamily II metal-dependent hydrolase